MPTDTGAPLLLIVCGDPSGDLHAASLIAALKRRAPGVRVAAVGGPLSRAVADEFVEDLAARGVTGFVRPILTLRFLRGLLERLEQFMRTRRPAALVCIDYYGFNRRVLERARRAGVPALYYVSPQVWASRPGRVHVLRQLVQRMLVIFPFEESLYREAGVPVEFVGHPLLDRIPTPAPRRPAPSAGHTRRVGLLPGSRRSELEAHVPMLLEAFRLLRETRPDLEGLIFAPPSQPDAAYGTLPPGVRLVREEDYAVRSTLDIALCKSGTATLENAMLGIPMVVLYRTSWPEYLAARAVARVKFIAMPNLLAGREVVTELIQQQATSQRLASEAAALLDNPQRYDAVRADLLALRDKLGGPGAADRAAAAILTALPVK